MFSLISAAALVLPSFAFARPSIDTALHAAHQVSTWQIDQAHSELRFRIRHFVNKVSGTFTDWDGAITGDPSNWADGSVTVSIRAKSVDTRNERRDNDLRSANFFEAEKYPELTFKSRSVTVTGTDIKILGDLTIKATTKPVTLAGSYLGITPGREGRDRVGFEVSTTINRLDYGVSWNRTVEGGGLMLGDDVTIEISIEAIRQPS